MPPYTFLTQVKIVIATMAIHNFIVEQRLQYEVLDETQQMNTLNNNNNEIGGEEQGTADELEMGIVRDNIRNQLVTCGNRH